MRNILSSKDAEPYKIYNKEGGFPCVITAEHASNRVPENMNGLGIKDKSIFKTSKGYDAFSREIAVEVSERLGAPLVTSEYSRLVVDCNRIANSKELIREGDRGTDIPANKNISKDEVKQRLDEIYFPFHKAITNTIQECTKKNNNFCMISVHSFNSNVGDWDIGLLWDIDGSLAVEYKSFLDKNYPDFKVGFNVPYDLTSDDIEPGSAQLHGFFKNIPTIEIEFNQGSMADEVKGKRIKDSLVEFLSTKYN